MDENKTPSVPEQTTKAVAQTKNTKEKKKIAAKKLPRNLKKSYTKRQLAKKLLSKIFIPKDREFVALQFVEDKDYSEKLAKKAAEITLKGKKARVKQGKLHIPQTIEYDKKDFNRLKAIGKQIRKQKGILRLLPLTACAILIVSIILFVTLAKNPLAKMAIIQGLQSMAGAKAEIGSVDIGIFDSRITINKMTVANKNKPMTNVFSAEKLEIDFNLLQLLKGRFVSENIEISGMAFGTERQTSGELPVVEAKPKKEDSELVKNIKAKQSDALEHTKSNVSNIFTVFDPQIILNDTFEQLQIPDAAKNVQVELERIIPVWKERPAEIGESVASFAKNTQAVIEYDYKAIENLSDLEDSFATLGAAIEDGIALSRTIEKTVNDLQIESKMIQNMVQTTVDAIKHDTNFVATKIEEISDFTIDDGINYISDSLQIAVLDTLDTYYPYIEDILELIEKPQETAAPVEPEKKQSVARMSGRTIDYAYDVYPSFLIERIFAGGPGFEAGIVDISNNPDKWGKPVSFNGLLEEEKAIGGVNRTHKAEIVVDARSISEAPLVFIEYDGSGYALSLGTSTNVPGIPSLTSTSTIIGTITGDWDGSVTVGARLNMNEVFMDIAAFEPDFIYRIYRNALNSIKDMTLALQIGFYPKTGIALDLDTDVDKQFISALKLGISQELNEIKKQIEAEIKVKLEKYIALFDKLLAEFKEIEKKINAHEQRLADLRVQLEQRNGETKKRLEDAANAAIEEAKEQLTEAAEEAVDELKEKAAEQAEEAAKELKDKATEALRGLFGR